MTTSQRAPLSRERIAGFAFLTGAIGCGLVGIAIIAVAQIEPDGLFAADASLVSLFTGILVGIASALALSMGLVLLALSRVEPRSRAGTDVVRHSGR
jgi:hypothetical protein